MREQKTIWGDIDWVLVIVYLVMVLFGWINIYAAVYNDEHQSILDISQNYGKQLMFIGVSVLIAIIIMIIDAKFFSAFSYFIYGAMILLLIGVLVMGKEIAGSKSWFQIGNFALQPAEFAKFATNLAIARYLSTMDIKMENLRTRIITIGLFALPAGLVFLQNDTGSALVYFAFLLVMYREGLSGNIFIVALGAALIFILTLLGLKWYIIGGVLLILVVVFFMIKKNLRNIIVLLGILAITSGFIFSVDYVFENVLEDHQRIRIKVFLGMVDDPQGVEYNVNQSKIAIGSGGFAGKGFLQGTQTKFDFVPEQSTDFIFCTVGEEWGFIGSIFTLGLFMFLLVRIVIVAERQRSNFSRIYGYGVASILFFHFAVNIGMTIGVAPIIGIPLPFFSYGGSSLIGFTILLFIFIKQDSYRMQLL